MIFAIGLVGLYLTGLAVSGLDPLVGQTAFALEQAVLGLIVLAFPPARRALLDAAASFWPAALAFAIVVGLVAWQAGMLGGPPAATTFNAYAARGEVWSLAALFFGAAGAAAAAQALGRRLVHNAFLGGVIVFATLDVVEKLQNGASRPFLASAGETAAVYALMAILAAFVFFDEARSNNGPGGGAQLSRKLVLPAAAFFAAALGLALSRSPLIIGALGAGLAALCVGLSLRDWRRPLGFMLLGAAAFLGLVSALAALAMGAADDPFGFAGFEESIATGMKGATGLGAGVEGGVLQIWPVQAGPAGAAAMAICALLILVRLVFATDRRRTPSRGFALALAALTAIAFAGPGGAGGAATATLALLLGLSAAYSDRLRALAQQPRTDARFAFEGRPMDPAPGPI